MNLDEERWAEALQIEKMHGTNSPVWVATRISELALAGDVAGVARLKEVAARLDLLVRRIPQ